MKKYQLYSKLREIKVELWLKKKKILYQYL